MLGQDDWRRIGGSGRCKDQSPPFVTISLRNWHAARRARITLRYLVTDRFRFGFAFAF